MDERMKRLLASLEDKLVFVDPHSHSIYSDGTSHPKEMHKYATSQGFHFIVTDHNDIRASKYFHAQRIEFVPAVEVTTASSIDFLVYFYHFSELEDFYKSHIASNLIHTPLFNLRKTRLTVEFVLNLKEKYDCKIVLPHPFALKPKDSHRLFDERKEYFKRIDSIEVYNAVLSKKANASASEWCSTIDKPLTAGSDAHTLSVLGNAMIGLDSFTRENFLKALSMQNKIIYSPISRFQLLKSQLTILKNNLQGLF